MDIQLAKKQVITFLIITAFLSCLVYILYFIHPPKGGFVLIMLCPGIAAIITRLIYQKNLRNFGWGWGKTRYQLISYFLPLFLGLIVYGLVWLTGLSGVSIDNFTNFVTAFFGFSERLSFIPAFLLFAFGVIFAAAIGAFGEEIGWRGLLVPELAKLTSFTKLSLLSGTIWGIWHIPGILFLGYSSGITPLVQIPCFLVMVVSASFVFAWLRLKSGSVWTAVILHSTHNLFIQGFFDVLTVDTGSTKYFTTEFGVGLALVYTVSAFICWKKRSELV